MAVIDGAASRPLPGFRDNGDAYLVAEGDGRWFGAVIDGLGHGPEALRAAMLARDILVADWQSGPDFALVRCHEALRGTRGAVVGAVWADLGSGRLQYVGIGNIEGLITGPLGVQRLTSIGGYLGGAVMRVRAFDYSFGVGDTLIMHSDGVSARFQVSDYPGLLVQPPEFIAQFLLREWGRTTDDATVLVARYEP